MQVIECCDAAAPKKCKDVPTRGSGDANSAQTCWLSLHYYPAQATLRLMERVALDLTSRSHV